jgi:deoxyribodipyrimidine photo-lyase
MTAIVWLRRELRVRDNPPLRAALDRHDAVVPVFCLDDRLLHGRHASGPRTQFMLECLGDLDASLRERGSALVIRRGPPEVELAALARATGAEALYASEDVSPFATARDAGVARALAGAGVEVRGCPGVFAVDDLRAVGRYTVFAAFRRAWLAVPRRPAGRAPRRLPPLPAGLDAGELPTLAELGLASSVVDPAPGGERAARDAVRGFLARAGRRYDDRRDELGHEGCSRLSPYLHFGCISPRELEQRLPAGSAGEAYRRQLCWREFFAQVMLHFPHDAVREHQERYRRDALRWSRSRRGFDAWREGRTGFPLVDAGMRQLRREGWMHNRARLVAGSFLTKHLAIDWRWGERWFMELLLDGDEASNNGNWQWIASVGVDPQPVFRRVLSPARQQERFDRDGAYVRRYVPELRGVPDRYLAEPARMPPAVQRAAGCVIGRDYPAPIVEHAAARADALARYRTARS